MEDATSRATVQRELVAKLERDDRDATTARNLLVFLDDQVRLPSATSLPLRFQVDHTNAALAARMQREGARIRRRGVRANNIEVDRSLDPSHPEPMRWWKCQCKSWADRAQSWKPFISSAPCNPPASTARKIHINGGQHVRLSVEELPACGTTQTIRAIVPASAATVFFWVHSSFRPSARCVIQNCHKTLMRRF